MSHDEFVWSAKVDCTGGAIMVVDSAKFGQWTGAIRFQALGVAERRNVLHFWGNLGGAGEQWVECDSEDQARAKLQGLHALAKRNCPDVVVTEVDGVTHFRDPRSGGELHAELEPKSEWDASWQANDADAWIHRFGDGAEALFWFVGDDLVDVGQRRGELVLLKGTNRAAARAHVAGAPKTESVAELTVASPRAVALWAPIAANEVLSARTLDAPARLDREGHLGVGAVLAVDPGRYVVSLGHFESDDVRCSWCRLTRASSDHHERDGA